MTKNEIIEQTKARITEGNKDKEFLLEVLIQLIQKDVDNIMRSGVCDIEPYTPTRSDTIKTHWGYSKQFLKGDDVNFPGKNYPNNEYYDISFPAKNYQYDVDGQPHIIPGQMYPIYS